MQQPESLTDCGYVPEHALVQPETGAPQLQLVFRILKVPVERSCVIISLGKFVVVDVQPQFGQLKLSVKNVTH